MPPSFCCGWEPRAGSAAKDNRPGFAGEIALFTTVFISASHFAALVLERFQQELAQLGFTLNTHFVKPEDLKNKSLPMTFIPERVQGIICLEMFDWDYDMMLCGLDIPILFVDGPCKRNGQPLPADHLYMDNTAGISQLVNDMLRDGYKEIGFIGNPDHCESFFERYAAFRGMMLIGDTPVSEDWIIRDNNANEIKRRLSSLNELPDLFICANDFIAADTMQALNELGKKVPDDIMICGFDDSAESRLIQPPLTTVRIHTQVMAFSAMHLLMSRIEQPSLDFRTIYTETDLIRRKSTER